MFTQFIFNLRNELTNSENPNNFGNLSDAARNVSSYVYGVFGAQRSRDCTVTVLVSQIKRGHVTALSQ